MSELFEQKANKLMSKLSSLNPGAATVMSKKTESILNPKPSSASSPLIQLHKFQQQIQTADEQNKKKIKVLHDQISKLQSYLVDQNDARNKISENFIATSAKVQKNMKSALQSIAKSFEDKQKKLEQKIQQILTQEKKQLESQMTQNESLIVEIMQLSKQLNSLESQLEQMKRSRYVLQEKIYKQFIEQIKELKKIYERDVKERQERQNQLIECLKGVYTALMEQIKKEQAEREQNERGFLTVVEQVISRIVDY